MVVSRIQEHQRRGEGDRGVDRGSTRVLGEETIFCSMPHIIYSDRRQCAMRLLKREIVKYRPLRLGVGVIGRDLCIYFPGFCRTQVSWKWKGKGDQLLVEASTVRGLDRPMRSVTIQGCFICAIYALTFADTTVTTTTASGLLAPPVLVRKEQPHGTLRRHVEPLERHPMARGLPCERQEGHARGLLR